MKKSSTDWLKESEFSGLFIMDPDGWDRRNYVASMAELITLKEFKRRVARSTHTFIQQKE